MAKISRVVCALVVAAGGQVAGQEWEPLAARLESVTGSHKHVYRLRDDGRRSMDCLEIFQPDASGKSGVDGVSPSSEGGVFSLPPPSSVDPIHWKNLV
ncbi:MAG: hypothetical protein ACR2RV_19530, partial [Verrucomicrobiales bacterium]